MLIQVNIYLISTAPLLRWRTPSTKAKRDSVNPLAVEAAAMLLELQASTLKGGGCFATIRPRMVAQRLASHSTAATTTRYYQQVNDSMKREAVERLVAGAGGDVAGQAGLGCRLSEERREHFLEETKR